MRFILTMMHAHNTEFVLAPVTITAGEIRFRWQVRPETTLFKHNTCFIRFPDTVDLDNLPPGFIARITMLLFHSFWVLLSPCRISLPFTLSPGEQTAWERLMELARDTLQGHVETESDFAISWSGTGPLLPRNPMPIEGPDGCAAAFSGGKDSLYQAGFLLDHTDDPLFVSTISANGATHKRKQEADHAIANTPGCRFMQVKTDYRSIYNNLFPREQGWLPAVNELNDVHLYLSNLLIASASHKRARNYLASEIEVQTSLLKKGKWVQHPHAMYSVASLKIIEHLFSPYLLSISSLTAPLNHYQIQRTLWTEWPALRRLQTSCWRMTAAEDLCNQCRCCLKASVTSLEAGEDPREMGGDLVTNLAACADWEPSLIPPAETPNEITRSDLHRQTVTAICMTPLYKYVRHFTHLRPAGPLNREWRAALRNVVRLKQCGKLLDPNRLTFYAEEYLSFVDAEHRETLRHFLEQHHKPGGQGLTGNQYYQNTSDMIAWATEPLKI